MARLDREGAAASELDAVQRNVLLGRLGFVAERIHAIARVESEQRALTGTAW